MAGIHRLITMIICTRNRPGLLRGSVESLIPQIRSNQSISLLVVDNAPEDSGQVRSGLLDEDGTMIRIVAEREIGLSYARNRGVNEADSEYIAFMDDDALADPGWASRAIGIITSIHPEIFGGPIYPFYDTEKPKWWKDAYETRQAAEKAGFLKSGEFLSGSNLVIKKSVFTKIGLFRTDIGMAGGKLSLGEESDLQEKARRASIGIYYDPNLVIRHYVPAGKMRLAYISRRHIISSKVSFSIFASGNGRKIIHNIIFRLAEITALIFYIPFRDRKRYPFWQNLYIERMLPRTRAIVWFIEFIRSRV